MSGFVARLAAHGMSPDTLQSNCHGKNLPATAVILYGGAGGDRVIAI